MPFKVFRKKMQGYCDRAGLTATFVHADGKHIAHLSNGYTATGNSVSKCVEFRNRNHCFVARDF